MHKLIIILFSVLLPLTNFGQQSGSPENIKSYDEIYSILKYKYPLLQYRSYYNLDSVYEKYRPEVLKSKSVMEAGQYSCQMIETLEDFHVRIWTGNNKCFALSTPLHWLKEFHSDSLQRAFWKNSDHTLYKSKFSKIKNEFYDDELPMIRYSRSKEIGYLNITRFEVKLGEDRKAADSIALSAAMDKIVKELDGVRVLIVDLRSCMGGWTEYGEVIASRLIKEKKHYSTTVKFKSVVDSSAAVKHFIRPIGPKQLGGQVVVLTNKVVRSAAEDFILMLKQIPNTYIIGEPTWGAFANSLYYELSNGWRFQCPNEKVYCPDGKIYEGSGIPVDLRLDNSLQDLINKNDKVLDAAIKYSR